MGSTNDVFDTLPNDCGESEDDDETDEDVSEFALGLNEERVEVEAELSGVSMAELDE